ncbi:hypothetical protein GGP81_002087 [Salinibacter ruber]|uniref:hypothetical protein n=1 Tax=Salinibacter ruber TaxID=146919 RepID=UPI00216A1CE7|nr:hypothetical protein [Salinibacter ruber]MCS3955556.1 hypothetical protein [Salinibacter ruber]
MRKRLKHLKRLLHSLDIDPSDPSANTHESVQAGVFLAQLLYQQEEYGEADITEQVGYFFKWYNGPYSSSLEEDYRELVDQLRFENATNGYAAQGSSLTRFAQQVGEAMSPPNEYGRSEWLLMTAAVAYLRAGADWSTEDARSEIQDSLGTNEHFDRAQTQLQDAGFEIPVLA